MDVIEVGRSILAAQPFSRLLGTVMTAYGNDAVELRLAVTEGIRQQHGFVHGGVLAYLADNALTFAAGLTMNEGVLPANGGVLTAEVKLNYLRPAVGELLIARAKTLHAGRTQGVSRCEIYAVREGVEHLCAAGQGTVMRSATAPMNQPPASTPPA